MNRRAVCCRALAATALHFANSPGTAATLVADGTARAVIIVPDRPSPVAAGAARVSQAHLELNGVPLAS